MRTLSFLISHLRRGHLPLLRRIPAAAAAPLLPPHTRTLHDLSQSPSPIPAPPSRILQSPSPASGEAAADDDEPMNEFLSRFVHSIRGKLIEAYPGVDRNTLDGMLLYISQKVIDAMDHSASPPPESTAADMDLSPELWETIWEVSNSVHESMNRDRVREELKKYLHCDDVKEMCRFAADVGIRGDLLRELRFKWTREKLEEVEFYRELDNMVEQGKKQEEAAKALGAGAGDEVEQSVKKRVLTELPQRQGKIKYKIYGLDLSDAKWAEVAEKVVESEKHYVPEEAQPIVGRCKKVDDKILGLDAKDDPMPLLAEWKQILQPKRVDWLALLNRIKERNQELYIKVSELVLNEETFETNIRDYSKLIDVYSKADRLEDAERILAKMTERGIMPDVLTSVILVHMYSKVGDLERAAGAFESLRKHGFQPDLKAYNSMITAYIKAGLPKQGELLIREMEAKCITPTKEIYMEVLRAFAERGQVDGAQRIVNMMQFAGIQPTLESCTLLVQAFGQAGDPDQARGHFDHMIKSGHRPDDKCAAHMMAAYVKKNLLDKALELLLTLEKDGFKPGIETYTVLVDWMGKLLLVDEAERLLGVIREMGEAPFEIHVSLCDMYSRAHQSERARNSLKVLEGRKELLRADQFERIVNGLLAGGLVEDAKRICEVMELQGFSPSEPLKVALMAASIPRQKPQTRQTKA